MAFTRYLFHSDHRYPLRPSFMLRSTAMVESLYADTCVLHRSRLRIIVVVFLDFRNMRFYSDES